MAEGQPHRYPTKFGASWVSVPSIAANRGPIRIPIVLTSPHSMQRARPHNLQSVRKQLSSNGLNKTVSVLEVGRIFFGSPSTRLHGKKEWFRRMQHWKEGSC